MESGSILQSSSVSGASIHRRTAVITYNTSHYVLLFRQNLIRQLQAQGYRVVAVAPRDGHSGRFRDIGVDYVPIDMDNKGANPLKDLRLLADLHRTYRRLRPDVALHFTIKPNIYGSIAAKFLGIPVVNNVTGLGTAFVRGGMLRRISETLYKLAFRHAEVVFFQNDDDFKLFRDARIVKDSQCAVLPGSGVDTNRFAPRPARPNGGPFHFLFIGRLIKDKGIGEYVEATKMLKARGFVFRSQVVGQLGSENRGAISQADIESWVEQGLVEYLGEVQDVREVIGQADCIVLPSYREGTSKTLLEAASMGKPLVASDVPGCNNIVESNVNGILCKPADAAELAEAMRRMLELPAERRDQMGREGRRRMLERFDESIVLKKYADALRHLRLED